MMNKAIKTQWLSALRSGEYQQAHGTLRAADNGGTYYCCLGVLCDLHRKAGLGNWIGGRYLDECEALPHEVYEWAEIGDDTNPWSPHAGMYRLAEYNDGADGIFPPHTFAQIADLIEQHL